MLFNALSTSSHEASNLTRNIPNNNQLQAYHKHVMLLLGKHIIHSENYLQYFNFFGNQFLLCFNCHFLPIRKSPVRFETRIFFRCDPLKLDIIQLIL